VKSCASQQSRQFTSVSADPHQTWSNVFPPTLEHPPRSRVEEVTLVLRDQSSTATRMRCVPNMPIKNEPPKKDARWPLVMLHVFMWAWMIGTTLNRDPVKLEFSITVVLGLLAAAGIVALLAHGRIPGVHFLSSTSTRPSLATSRCTSLASRASYASAISSSTGSSRS
jgi:hypothetical protein